jgi:hypothetical protein
VTNSPGGLANPRQREVVPRFEQLNGGGDDGAEELRNGESAH